MRPEDADGLVAKLHRGRVVHCWDHFVIGLRTGAAAETTLSLYAITYSPTLGSGHVAFLDVAEGPILAWEDAHGLGNRMQARFRDIALPGRSVEAAVEAARFARHPMTSEGFGFSVQSARSTLEARWTSPEPAFWTEGPAPAFWEREDIWACFIDSPEAEIRLDGQILPGSAFEDDRWYPKLGRSLSSAHVALSEMRVTPA